MKRTARMVIRYSFKQDKVLYEYTNSATLSNSWIVDEFEYSIIKNNWDLKDPTDGEIYVFVEEEYDDGL